MLSLRGAQRRGNPLVRTEMYQIVPGKTETDWVLVVIDTWFHSFGGLPRPLRPQARPERNRRRRLLARRSLRTGLAMTGNLERSDKQQFILSKLRKQLHPIISLFLPFRNHGFFTGEGGKTLTAPGVFAIVNFLRMGGSCRANLRHILQKMQRIVFFLANYTPKEYTSKGKKTRK